MKKLILYILSFLAILSPIHSIKAFTPNEHETSSRNAISIRTGSTNIYSINCTSGNFCYLNFSDVSSSTFNFNRLTIQYLNSSNMSFKTGSIYKINLYFSSFINHNVMYADDVSGVTGVSYQNLTSWPSNDLVIKSWNLKEIDEIDYQTFMYNLEVIFQTTNSTVAGLSFNLNFKNTKTGQKDSGNGFIIYRWYDLETLNDYNDYTQDFNNVINNQTQNTQNIINNQNQNTQDVIDNQNQNTQDVIDNQNQNTQDVIDNQNQNTQDIINSNKSCRDVETSINKFSVENAELNSLGSVISNNNWNISIYYELGSDSIIKVINDFTTSTRYGCFYDNDKLKLSCVNLKNFVVGDTISIPTGAKFFRFSIYKSQDRPKLSIRTCSNGSQVINDSITDDNVNGASNEASNFFNNFTETDHGGLSAIITAPLVVVNSMLTNNSCQDLTFQVLGADVKFPSGCILWNLADSTIVTLWQTIVCGFISYVLLKKLFKDIEDLKNPNNQEVSTLDL